MIIVEGMDNAGKTTLVSKLSGDLRLLTICNRRRPPDLLSSFDYLERVVPLAARFPTIFDRWQPISEPIYGPICRNTNLFTPQDIEKQHRYVVDNVGFPLIIYCRPSTNRILSFGDREQMDGVIDHAEKLLDAYDLVMAGLAKRWFHVVRYDYERDAYDDIKKDALAHLHNHDQGIAK